MRALSRSEVRELDRRAIEELGLPGVVLMENAGGGAAACILKELTRRYGSGAGSGPGPGPGPVTILCGGGNNGGDGYVVARHLHNAGVSVALVSSVPPERLTGDALVQRRVVERMGLEIVPATTDAEIARVAALLEGSRLLVDALLGTGFEGRVREPLARLIETANELRERLGIGVVALDLPSGLDCDTGDATGPVLRADRTITFAAPKLGFAAASAGPWVGEVEVVSIGTPREWTEVSEGGAR